VAASARANAALSRAWDLMNWNMCCAAFGRKSLGVDAAAILQHNMDKSSEWPLGPAHPTVAKPADRLFGPVSNARDRPLGARRTPGYPVPLSQSGDHDHHEHQRPDGAGRYPAGRA
jgi:hypothetical protein